MFKIFNNFKYHAQLKPSVLKYIFQGNCNVHGERFKNSQSFLKTNFIVTAKQNCKSFMVLVLKPGFIIVGFGNGFENKT